MHWLVPLLENKLHVHANQLEHLLQSLGIVRYLIVLRREKHDVAAVEVAMRHILQDAALEGPHSPRRFVQLQSSVDVDDFRLALLLCKITLSLAASAHQVQANDYVENFN